MRSSACAFFIAILLLLLLLLLLLFTLRKSLTRENSCKIDNVSDRLPRPSSGHKVAKNETHNKFYVETLEDSFKQFVGVLKIG